MPRELAIMECTVCKRRNYTTTRNKKTQTARLELLTFCPHDRKRTVHKEQRSPKPQVAGSRPARRANLPPPPPAARGRAPRGAARPTHPTGIPT